MIQRNMNPQNLDSANEPGFAGLLGYLPAPNSHALKQGQNVETQNIDSINAISTNLERQNGQNWASGALPGGGPKV